MVPRLIHNRPGSGVLRECLAQVRYVAAAPPARKKAIVGKSRVAATRLQRGEATAGRLDQNAATGILVRSILALWGHFAPMPVE